MRCAHKPAFPLEHCPAVARCEQRKEHRVARRWISLSFESYLHALLSECAAMGLRLQVLKGRPQPTSCKAAVEMLGDAAQFALSQLCVPHSMYAGGCAPNLHHPFSRRPLPTTPRSLGSRVATAASCRELSAVRRSEANECSMLFRACLRANAACAWNRCVHRFTGGFKLARRSVLFPPPPCTHTRDVGSRVQSVADAVHTDAVSVPTSNLPEALANTSKTERTPS
jgi:hypothetical protein